MINDEVLSLLCCISAQLRKRILKIKRGNTTWAIVVCQALDAAHEHMGYRRKAVDQVLFKYPF